MPKKVDEIHKAIRRDHPEISEDRSWAMAWASYKKMQGESYKLKLEKLHKMKCSFSENTEASRDKPPHMPDSGYKWVRHPTKWVQVQINPSDPGADTKDETPIDDIPITVRKRKDKSNPIYGIWNQGSSDDNRKTVLKKIGSDTELSDKPFNQLPQDVQDKLLKMYGEPTDEPTAKTPDVDETAKDELGLFIDNDKDLYRQKKQPIIDNLVRKMKLGTYDSAKAPILFQYLVDDGAKKYAKDNGGDYKQMFPKALRQKLAQDMAKDFEGEYKAGGYGDAEKKDEKPAEPEKKSEPETKAEPKAKPTPEQEKILSTYKRRGKGKGVLMHFKDINHFDTVLNHGTYALVSSGKNPNNADDMKLSDEQIAKRHEVLRNDLIDMGYVFSPVKGKYGGLPEDTFMVMVHDPSEPDILKIGEKFNQDSVILTSEGKNKMIFTTGTNKGKRHEGEGVNKLPKDEMDFYTQADINGVPYKFNLNFNFDKLENYRGKMLEMYVGMRPHSKEKLQSIHKEMVIRK